MLNYAFFLMLRLLKKLKLNLELLLLFKYIINIVKNCKYLFINDALNITIQMMSSLILNFMKNDKTSVILLIQIITLIQ